MSTLEGLRRQIRSTEELGSIVRTMKSLAAGRIRQLERAAQSLARFDETVELGFHVLLRRLDATELDPGDGGRRVCAVVLGSAQGMSGPFNDRIVTFVDRWLGARAEELERGPVLVVGHRTADLMQDTAVVPDLVLTAPSSLAAVTGVVDELLIRAEDLRAQDRFDRLLVFHNRRIEGSLASPRAVQHLPLPASWLRELARRPWEGPSLPTFTLEPGALLSELIRQRLFGSLWRSMVESLESESASRLEAMQAAEKNVADLLEELRAAFRQERQASITAELLDILSGYEVSLEPREEAREAKRGEPVAG